MTLKYAFSGLASGGAKAALLGDPEMPAPEKHELLAAFFKALLPILQSRLYLPRPDMGTNQAELDRAAAAAGFTRAHRQRGLGERSALYTGFSVVGAALGALDFLRLPIAGSRAVIEGFGKVGSAAARLFAAHGVKVVGVSTRSGAIYSAKGLDVAALSRLYDREGSRLVDSYRDADRLSIAELLELAVDVLSPCARFQSIHAGNAARIRAKLISAGANDPTAADAEQTLSEIGCLVLPDFATNSGGMLGEAMEFTGLGVDEIKDFIVSRFRARTGAFLAEAQRQRCSPRQLIEPMLVDRSRLIKARAERSGIKPLLYRGGREFYRRGLIPRFVARRLAPGHFDKRLFKLADVN